MQYFDVWKRYTTAFYTRQHRSFELYNSILVKSTTMIGYLFKSTKKVD